MRIVIADDAALIREGVAHLLTESGLDVVDQVGDADALLASVRDTRPDVALVDIRMPPTHTDEGLVQPVRFACGIRRQLSSCSRSISNPTTRCGSSRRGPKASAT